MILDHFENVNLCAHEIAVLNAKYYTVPPPPYRSIEYSTLLRVKTNLIY